MRCPIANWRRQSPNALAFDALTYSEFNHLIGQLCKYLSSIPNSVLSFAPQKRYLDVAFFFAAWRLGKIVYPLNPRLPRGATAARLKQTKGYWIDLDSISLGETLEIDTLAPLNLATYLETSSAKKIVCHKLVSLLISAENSAKALMIHSSSIICLNLPLFHISGIASFLRAFLFGGRVISAPKIAQATHVSMVPTQLYRHLQHQTSFPQLKCLLTGGAPLPNDLYFLAVERGIPLFQSYGMTETAALALLTPLKQQTVVLSHIEYQIATDGELLLRGPSLFKKYLGKPLRKDTDWFYTNDLVKFEKGTLNIIGRKDRQFISGGENIQPEEIEKALLECFSILEAKVEPEPDPEFGMRPIAQVYSAHSISEESLELQLREKLPSHKIPIKIEISSASFDSKLTKLST